MFNWSLKSPDAGLFSTDSYSTGVQNVQDTGVYPQMTQMNTVWRIGQKQQKTFCTRVSRMCKMSRISVKLKIVMLNDSLKSPGCWTSADGLVFRQCPGCPK